MQSKQYFTKIKNYPHEKSTEPKLTDKAEVREALAKNKLRTKMQEWDFYFTIPEGVQAVQQISYIHSYPRKMYGRYMEQIDETLAAIDEVYK